MHAIQRPFMQLRRDADAMLIGARTGHLRLMTASVKAISIPHTRLTFQRLIRKPVWLDNKKDKLLAQCACVKCKDGK